MVVKFIKSAFDIHSVKIILARLIFRIIPDNEYKIKVDFNCEINTYWYRDTDAAFELDLSDAIDFRWVVPEDEDRSTRLGVNWDSDPVSLIDKRNVVWMRGFLVSLNFASYLCH